MVQSTLLLRPMISNASSSQLSTYNFIEMQAHFSVGYFVDIY